MKNKPRIRFKGFTEDWEQRKLESLFTKYEDKVNTPNSGYWRLGLRSHCKGTFHTYIDAGNELETAEMNRVKSGNFILNITFAWERALAVTNDEDQDKLVSHRFPQFKPNSDLVIDFFKHTLMNKRFKHHLELSSPGGAGRNKVLKVADMLKYELLVPSIKEQNEISSLLNHVDYIITLHHRKLEKLKLAKKALLQKLFPKNGSQFPEIRFKGFTDAWEQRKLGNLGTLKNGMNFSKEAMGKGYPFINLQNIFGSNVIDLTKLEKAEATDSQLKDYNLQKGDVLFVRSSVKLEGVGEAALISEDLKDTTFCGFIIRFRDNYGLDYNFKRFIFTTVLIRNQIMSQATNSANKNISQSVLNNLNLFIPTKDEQSKIGLIFSKLDKCITLHQCKLDKLQDVKKGLLQKMFV